MVLVTRRLRRALVGAATAAVAGLVVLSAVPGTSAAAPAPACPRATVKLDIKAADAVFRGVVTKARAVQGSGRHRTREYRVAVDRVYKGSLVTDKVRVTARLRAARCNPLQPLVQGKRFIFFTTEKGARLLAATGTARAGRQLTRQVVNQLGDGKQPQVQPPASAEFTRVADADPPPMSRLLAPGAALLIVALLGLLVVGRLGRRTPG
jgi:hypothetical protein